MIYSFTKRSFDITCSFLALGLLCIPMIIIVVLIKFTSPGPAFYLSKRIGIENSIFKMFKFRTMVADAPVVATHLLNDPRKYVTSIGKFLRKYSIDELPQLINILKGDMSFVGPRPALFNQDDLVVLRSAKGIQHLIPGLTGWAQINGRDDLPIPVKVNFDEYYLSHRCFVFDLKILFITILRVIKKEGVQH